MDVGLWDRAGNERDQESGDGGAVSTPSVRPPVSGCVHPPASGCVHPEGTGRANGPDQGKGAGLELGLVIYKM